MALQLFKLASEKWPSISGTTSQAVHQYFHTFSATNTYGSGSDISLAVGLWFTNTGGTTTAFATNQGMTNLCINGVLQQPGLYTVEAAKVTIVPPVGGLKMEGYPLTLQTYNANAGVVVSTVKSRVAIP